MKRKNALLAIKDFLEKQNKSSCCEITIFPHQLDGAKKISRRRSIIIVDIERAQIPDLESYLSSKGLDESLTSVEFYENLNDFVSNSQIALEDLSLENSWRGRVLRFNIDFSLNDSNIEFEKKFLRSYFRLIISKREGNYFAKHDITPTYFSPGTSTPGFPEFENSIEEFVKYLAKASDRLETFAGYVDIDFDFIRIFISKDSDLPFEAVRLWDEEIVPFTTFLDTLTQAGTQRIVADFQSTLNRAFGIT